MRKKVMIGVWVLWMLFHCAWALAAEDSEYRFERLWPELAQPWYFNSPQGIAIAPDGSVYVADTDHQHIKHFSAEGAYLGQWGSYGSGDGQFVYPSGLAIAADGSVYVADNGNNRIQHFSAEGTYLGQWGSYGSGDGQFKYPAGIAIAAGGSVYVVDLGNHRIQHFSAEGTYLGQWGRVGSGDGQFNNPHGIAVAANGSVYVADKVNQRIQHFSAEGTYLSQWGSNGSGNGQFHHPAGIAIAPGGSVYVADTDNHRIQQFSADGAYLGQWGSEGPGDGEFSSPNGNGIATNGLAIAADGSVYVVDNGNNRIQQFSAEGAYLSQWGNQGSGDGLFRYPFGIAIGSGGSVYVADTYNHRIQHFSADGGYLGQWGSEGSGDGQFSLPKSIAIGADGSVYVTDSGNDRIQQFSAEGAYLRQWGNQGSGDGLFILPAGIAIGSDGSLYVTDSGNDRIQHFSAEGAYLGQWGSQGSGDGQFDSPEGLAIGADGSVYVADSGNHRIQQFSAEGAYLGQWGSFGSEDGQFILPAGIAIAPDGSVYVSGIGTGLGFYGSHRIQYFSAEGAYLGQWGSEGSGDGLFSIPRSIAIAPDRSMYVVDLGNHRIQKFVPKSKSAAPHPYKAIILAGGGQTIGGRINDIWEGTWRVSLQAYKALSRQAFRIHDEIKFLSADRTDIDLDNNGQFDDLEAASLASLQSAITDWAADAEDVVIFLANHGGPGKFQVNGAEILTGEDLNQWVSELENRISGTVTVVIEACNSGSFFQPLSAPQRYLFASAKAEQPAVISNGGLNSFSYFFWSEVGVGASLKNAFKDARQAMSKTKIEGSPQDAQTDADGNRQFDSQDFNALGNYCLGNCNQTAAAGPVIAPISPNSRTLYGETRQDFAISVNHLQPLVSAWALVQRPDDISIDPNRPLNFEKINLSCDAKGYCQGHYDRFDVQGEYRLNFYAMDDHYDVSFPESLTIQQRQGAAVAPVEYDDTVAVVYLRDVLVDGQHYQGALSQQGDKFVLFTASDAPTNYAPAAQFDFNSGLLTIPEAKVGGAPYQATFRHLGNFEFQLMSAQPK